MKRNSSKKPSTPIKFTPTESSAIIDALDFMSMCNSFAFENQKFTIDHVERATEKIEGGDVLYSRSELRSISVAIDFTIQCLLKDPAAVEQVREDCPELISSLEVSRSTLISLCQRFHAYLAR